MKEIVVFKNAKHANFELFMDLIACFVFNVNLILIDYTSCFKSIYKIYIFISYNNVCFNNNRGL